jgi:RHS repeat-associated protein
MNQRPPDVDTGSYLNRTVTTDTQGHARFTVPIKPYKFRIDYNGRQYWTSVITPIAHQPLSVQVPLEQLALMPTNNPRPSRYDGEAPIFVGEPVKVASIGSLIGLVSQSVVAQTAQTKVYYYLTDHLGTPQKLIDATGAVVWSADYKPLGEVLSTVSTIQNTFRFPGQYYDPETALHYNYHRYYHARTGRYLTPDPIGFASGHLNIFVYASNNPCNSIDPSGLMHYYIPETPHDVGPPGTQKHTQPGCLDPGWPIDPRHDPWPYKTIDPPKPPLIPYPPTIDLKKLLPEKKKQPNCEEEKSMQ